MNKTALTLATLLGLSVSGAAFAQDLDFNALDADLSGTISIEELQAALPSITPELFASYDTDGDGVLSAEEFDALAAAEGGTAGDPNGGEAGFPTEETPAPAPQ